MWGQHAFTLDAGFQPFFPPPSAVPAAAPRVESEPDVPWLVESDPTDWRELSEWVIGDWLEEAGLELSLLLLGPQHEGDEQARMTGRDLARQLGEKARDFRRHRKALHHLRLSRNHGVDVIAGAAVVTIVPGPLGPAIWDPMVGPASGRPSGPTP